MNKSTLKAEICFRFDVRDVNALLFSPLLSRTKFPNVQTVIKITGLKVMVGMVG